MTPKQVTTRDLALAVMRINRALSGTSPRRVGMRNGYGQYGLSEVEPNQTPEEIDAFHSHTLCEITPLLPKRELLARLEAFEDGVQFALSTLKGK